MNLEIRLFFDFKLDIFHILMFLKLRHSLHTVHVKSNLFTTRLNVKWQCNGSSHVCKVCNLSVELFSLSILLNLITEDPIEL